MKVQQFQVLTKSAALTSGSDLWIVADQDHSLWTQHLDWYLNFQLVRARRHLSAHLGVQLVELQSRWELPTFSNEMTSSSPLMIASQNLLPNQLTVLIPFLKDLADWIVKSQSIWINLLCPNLRIFVPSRLSADEITKQWNQLDRTPTKKMIPGSMTLVLE